MTVRFPLWLIGRNICVVEKHHRALFSLVLVAHHLVLRSTMFLAAAFASDFTSDQDRIRRDRHCRPCLSALTSTLAGGNLCNMYISTQRSC